MISVTNVSNQGVRNQKSISGTARLKSSGSDQGGVDATLAEIAEIFGSMGISNSTEVLKRALREGYHLQNVRDAIAAGARVNDRDQESGSFTAPIAIAALERPNLAAVNLLLENGALPEDQCCRTTPSSLALMPDSKGRGSTNNSYREQKDLLYDLTVAALETSTGESLQILERLIRAGADPNAQWSYGSVSPWLAGSVSSSSTGRGEDSKHTYALESAARHKNGLPVVQAFLASKQPIQPHVLKQAITAAKQGAPHPQQVSIIRLLDAYRLAQETEAAKECK